jgi:hypothetical protein
LQEADEFYRSVTPPSVSPDAANVMRQAIAGMLWSKQYFFFDGDSWLEEHNSHPLHHGYRNSRNSEWYHMLNEDIISMPDKWEYPWYAAWDLAFHTLPLAIVDPDFAKEQMGLMLRGLYLHPSGQMPAYEWNFSDVNPPVHAFATLFLHRTEQAMRGETDLDFLKSAFNKLLLNFTWWVNRKDPQGLNIFEGGFLGLDNIGVFDRSRPLPTGGHLEQADGTAWMAFYAATMLSMALELARDEPAYEDMASKFFEHFIAITDAMNNLGGTGLWDEKDGFYYDRLHMDGQSIPLRVRSLVGLVPLFAVEVLEENLLDRLPAFKKRMLWFLKNRRDLATQISYLEVGGEPGHQHLLLAIPSRERLTRVLRYLLDEKEFLSDFGIRSLSRVHMDHPYVFNFMDQEYRVDYVPAEGNTGLFGGNSNWRGPIWFPINYLILESLKRYHQYFGDDFKVECPTGSGTMMTLAEVTSDLSRRLSSIFLPGSDGARPVYQGIAIYRDDPHWKDLVLFHEYFHGDTGKGLGASHQTGWTGLVAKLLDELGGEEFPFIVSGG